MLNRLKYTLWLVIAVVLMNSCKNEMIGPDIEAIGSQPAILSALARSKDTIKTPLSESIYFNAQFDKDAAWVIKLTGEESGAKYTISGVGSKVDQSNSSWSGISDNPPVKFSNESVTAELSFPNSPDLTSSSIKFYIYSTGAFNNTHSVLVSDFTKTKFYGFGQSHPNDGNKWWASEYPLPSTTHTLYGPSLDGNTYAFFSGKPGSATNPKVFYTELKAADRDGGLTTDLTFPLYVNPDLVYFNIDVYSPAPALGSSPAWLIIVFTESNGSIRQLELKQPNWSGWKTISVKYSDLKLMSGVGSGNPDELATIGMVFLSASADATETVSLGVDHLIFTYGKPFQY